MRLRPAARCSRRSPWSTGWSRTARLSGMLAAALLLLLSPGSARAELPPPGTDALNVAVTLEVIVEPFDTEMIPLVGKMTLMRGAGTPDMIPLQITGLTLDGVLWAFSSLSADNWHPLTWISHMADVAVFGLDPRARYGSASDGTTTGACTAASRAASP